MYPSRRRKKRPNYGMRTVEVSRGPNGFGFTISGQQPCIMSCIVPQSPADQAGLKAGDFLISVNGTSVSKSTHDAVVNLIGNCLTPIRMTIAEHYYSDTSSSDSDENVEHLVRTVNTRRPKHRVHRLQHRKLVRAQHKVENGTQQQQQQHCAMEDEGGPIEYRAIVGYLGTIEMPRQVVPVARLQTVCSCIRKLRQEKRVPTAVLMTVLPTCLTLKNASNHILAIYPTNRVVYISSSMEKNCRYFGLVTSAINDTRCPSVLSSTSAVPLSNVEEGLAAGNASTICIDRPSTSACQNDANASTSAAVVSEHDDEVDISNSCHVFVTDPKLILHSAHAKKAEQFHIECTEDSINANGNQYCVEFPRNALCIVSLVQNLYRLQHDTPNGINGPQGPVAVRGDIAAGLHNIEDQLMANSPQPSASSNSDSGIGFRDDCGNISDRILVVEFPYTRPYRVQLPPKGNNDNVGHCSNSHNSRPINISAHLANNIGDKYYENNNVVEDSEQRATSSKSGLNNNVAMQQRMYHGNGNNVRLNNVVEGEFEGVGGGYGTANVRANDSLSIKNILERSHTNDYWIKQNNTAELYRDCNSDLYQQQQQRLTVRAITSVPLPSTSQHLSSSAYNERPVDVHEINTMQDTCSINLDISQNDGAIFKTPHPFDTKKSARKMPMQQKSVDSKTERGLKENNNKYVEDADCSFDASSVTSASGGALSSQSRFSGSWQNLALLWSSSNGNTNNSLERKRKQKLSSAHSEPDVRRDRCLTPTPSHQAGPVIVGTEPLWRPLENYDLQFSISVEESVSITYEEGNNCKEHPDDPATWSTSFEKLLECPWGLQTFADFLKKEFSAENIYFWTACERFKRLNPGLERTAEAQRIYQQHLCVGAPEAVNVDSKARQYTEQALQDGSPSLFNQAQKQIFNLMKFDSYTRFLKSDLYNLCLNGNVRKHDLETGLLTYPLSMITSGKLKKSLSNAEDRRRKSLLPWHRKNRSKSKDRGELEYNNNTNSYGNVGSVNENDSVSQNAHETSHSVSSLTSIDLALHSANHEANLASMASITSASMGTSGDDTASVTSSTNSARTALCRVILSNGSTTVVQIQPSETIEQLIGRLLHKRGIHYRYYVVHSDKHDKPIDISEPSQKIAGCEVSVEWRVSFKLYLPNDKIIGVKSKCNKKLVEILRPILVKYSFNIDQVVVFHNNEYLDVNIPITVLDGARITIQLREANFQETLKKTQSSVQQTTLEEITNRVYEDILLEKSDIVEKSKSERGSVKSEDWGSEHSSSGIFGRFLRRDSAIHERKKKQGCASYKARCNGQQQAYNQLQQQQLNQPLLCSSSQSSVEDVATMAAVDSQNYNNGSTAFNNSQVMKKPLIAKWKSGVKLQVACASESEELYEGVSRAQRSRLEDQRGTEINYELPEFLKSKEQMNKLRKIQQNPGQMTRSPTAKINTGASLDSSLSRIIKSNSNYENRSILVPSITNHSPDKFVNSEIAKYNKMSLTKSPCKFKSMDPPPLPPKPKILPMRPSNWGGHSTAGTTFKIPVAVASHGTDCANGVQVPTHSPPLFLEQPTSSFV